MKRLRSLQDENAKLKRLLADAMLDNAGLKNPWGIVSPIRSVTHPTDAKLMLMVIGLGERHGIELRQSYVSRALYDAEFTAPWFREPCLRWDYRKWLKPRSMP